MPTTTNGDNCVSLMKGTLVRPIARYPTSIAADETLKVAANQVQATLSMSACAGDASFRVSDTSRLVVDMLLSIDNEIVSVSAIDAASSLITVVRGFDGTFASAHSAGSALRAYITAWHHNALAAEITAIETALGPDLSNIGAGVSGYGVMSVLYDFPAQTPGGSLIVGANTITLSPVPKGVNGTDTDHYLYISGGTGTVEAVKIVGGTAVAGAASGTLILQCANTHSGAWMLQSATAGAQEAIIAHAGAPGYFDVKLPNGVINWYATVHSTPDTPGVTISGQGTRSTKIQMYTDMPVFKFEDVYYPSVRNLEIQYWVTGTANVIEFRNCPLATVFGVASTGPSGVSFENSSMMMRESLINVQSASGKGIFIHQTSTEGGWILNNFINSTVSGGRAAVGLDITRGTGMLLTGNEFVEFSTNLNMSPAGASTGYVGGNLFTGNFFDGGIIGVRIAPTSGACVDRTIFTGNWMCRATTSGLIIDGTGGIVKQLTFTANEIMASGLDGANINTMSGLVFTGNSVSDNSVTTPGASRGVLLAAVTKGTVSGNMFGCYDNTPKHTADLLLGAGVDRIAITGNSFRGWVDAPVSDASAGLDKMIGDNDGQAGLVVALTAAATLNLTYAAEVYDLSGTTAVTALTGGWNNRNVLFIRTAAGSVTVMGLPLAQNGRIDASYNAGRWWLK